MQDGARVAEGVTSLLCKPLQPSVVMHHAHLLTVSYDAQLWPLLSCASPSPLPTSCLAFASWH
jgi:hypothetical protein